MAMTPGSFVWFELATTDVSVAQPFYKEVVGWTVVDAGMPGMRYLIGQAAGRPVVGLMDMPPGMEGAARWFGYVLVADVDDMMQRLAAAGGAVHRPAMDIPGVGRFAVVADPQGAVFMLFRGDGTAPPPLPPGTPGTIGWHELRARDWPAAFAFYETLFGWRKTEAVDMEPFGIYQTFAVEGTAAVGGMMTSPDAPMPAWQHYVNVGSIEAAAERIVAAGGMVRFGPQEVPGGNWVLHATDPQGAAFSLVGPHG